MNKSKKIWVKKATSFKDAEEFDLDYYLKMKPSLRLSTVQYLREQYLKIFNKGKTSEYRKGLRRVYKVVKQT